jgi:flavin reductase (NADH)/flavin reductase/chlorophenol-4-monooxygenase component 1
MLAQTEVRSASSGIVNRGPTEEALQKSATYVSAEEYREALSRVASSVAVVTTDGPHGIAGFTCSAVCSVTDDPPTIMVCVNRKSAANAIIKANGVLCVNSLSSEQVELSQIFAGVGKVPMQERFIDPHWRTMITGAPCCIQARVAIDCRVSDVYEIGTHSVILAEVLSTTQRATDDQPLIYHGRNYATIRNVT